MGAGPLYVNKNEPLSYNTTMIEINNRMPKRVMIKALLKRKYNTIQPEREFHFKYK